MSRSFFFFCCLGGDRDLHSFPTRRSSDLCDPHGLPRLLHGDGRSRPRERLDVRASRGPSRAVRDRRLRDRKSTRLNSSHLGISYAVFCLKKKTTRMSSSDCNPEATSSSPG